MIPYMGGKSYLAGWIINSLPKDYTTMSYCEVFGGGGWVLFKKERSFIETYNDLNKSLVNLFRIIRDDFKKFQHKAEWSLHSREMFDEARRILKQDKIIRDLDKALYFAITKCQSFSAKEESWGYCLSTGNKTKYGRWLPFLKRMDIINARLKGVQIECLDFERLIEKYDSNNTIFYLDPPYVGKEFYYKTKEVDFRTEDHERLANVLKNIKGKFLLSYYEDVLVRKLYKGFIFDKTTAVKSSQGITRKTTKKTRDKSIELLISNY